MNTLADTLAVLIDIPSVTGDEQAICDHVSERLSSNAPHLTLKRVNNSLLAVGAGDGPLVVLAGHLDTVPPQGQPPARIDGGRMHGLGASDMKGGVAVMLHLLEDAESLLALPAWPADLLRGRGGTVRQQRVGTGAEPSATWLTSAILRRAAWSRPTARSRQGAMER